MIFNVCLDQNYEFGSHYCLKLLHKSQYLKVKYAQSVFMQAVNPASDSSPCVNGK